jgi:peptidoglycan/LPS O-acetylase OafA/YrhL
MTKKRFLILLGIIATLLLIPFVAMQFTTEVNWTAFDFIVMGLLLLGVGTAIEFILRKVKTKSQKIALVVAAIGVFLLIWVELAVGL